MQNIIHASFACAADGILAAEYLLSHGARAEDISLILPESNGAEHLNDMATSESVKLGVGSHASEAAHPALVHRNKVDTANTDVPAPPQLPPLPRLNKPHYYDSEALMAPGATGYTYDAMGAVIPDRSPTKKKASRRRGRGETVIGTEESAGLGLGLGLLTAMCIPGLGMVAGAGPIVAGLMAAGAAAGGIGGGLYGWLISRGVGHDTAQSMSHRVQSGRATISVTASNVAKAAEILEIINEFDGRLIGQSH